MIKKQGSSYVVKTADGSRTLGKHDTKAEAEAQLRAIEASKHRVASGGGSARGGKRTR